MAIKAETPVDELTRFPLPFVPRATLPPVPLWGDDNYNRDIANFHHPIHNRREIESYGAGGESARDSRIQWVLRRDHDRFHREWGGLCESMPRTEYEQYQITLFGAMRYIPEKGISFSRLTPREVYLTGAQRERLRTSGEIKIGNNGARVRHFLLAYTLKNGIHGVDPDLIDQFLWLSSRPNTRPGRQLTIADYMLRQAIEPTVATPLEEIYTYAKRNHMLRPHLPRALGAFIRREIIFGSSGSQDFVRLVLDQCQSLQATRILLPT